MSRTVSGTGTLISRLIFSILLVFTLLGTVAGTIGAVVTASPALLVSQLEKQDAAQKAHDTLQTSFNTAYNATAVPAEVYMDVITVDWMADAMENWVTANYAGNENSLDFTALEKSITDYFEQFAEDNHYEKDDAYTTKLEETIADAKTTVQSAVDAYHIQTMQKAGIWAKLDKVKLPLVAVAVGCGVLSIVLILLLLKNRPCYWIGSSLFASGVLLTIPTAWILGASIITRFALKEPAVYAVFTGTMTALTQTVLIIGIVLLAIGLVLWVGSVLHGKKQPSEVTEA